MRTRSSSILLGIVSRYPKIQSASSPSSKGLRSRQRSLYPLNGVDLLLLVGLQAVLALVIAVIGDAGGIGVGSSLGFFLVLS